MNMGWSDPTVQGVVGGPISLVGIIITAVAGSSEPSQEHASERTRTARQQRSPRQSHR